MDVSLLKKKKLDFCVETGDWNEWNDFYCEISHFSDNKAPQTLKQTAMYKTAHHFCHQQKTFNKVVRIQYNRK